MKSLIMIISKINYYYKLCKVMMLEYQVKRMRQKYIAAADVKAAHVLKIMRLRWAMVNCNNDLSGAIAREKDPEKISKILADGYKTAMKDIL